MLMQNMELRHILVEQRPNQYSSVCVPTKRENSQLQKLRYNILFIPETLSNVRSDSLEHTVWLNTFNILFSGSFSL